MFRFRGIEGLRGWLACVVMAYHVLALTGVSARFAELHGMTKAADYSVLVFIIISGFVITHLLLTRPEPYGAYITRRFLRIYPVYLVCLCLGILTTYLTFQTFLSEPWGTQTPNIERMSLQLESLRHGGFVLHLLAHLSMLHGAIPSNVLYESQIMFLSTAWSLSLEWQFYLLAPLILAGLRGVGRGVLLAVVTLCSYLAYKSGWFGSFLLPSFLPSAALYFAVGIATRTVIYKLPRLDKYPGALTIVACGLCFLSSRLIPFVAWAMFVAWMLLDQPAGRLSRAVETTFATLFDSRAAQYVGDLSYPIYLVHVPVLHIILFFCVRAYGLGMLETFAIATVLTPMITLLAAIALHRFVEKPCIAYGRTLFKAKSPLAVHTA